MTATPSNAGSRSRGARTTQILARWRQWLPAAEVRVDLVFSAVLVLLALVGFSTTYYGYAWLIVGAVGILLGLLVSHLVVSRRWPAAVTLLVLAAVYLVLGGPIAVREGLIGGVIPTPEVDRRAGVHRGARLEDAADLAAADRLPRPVDGAPVPLRAGRGGGDLHRRPHLAPVVCGTARPPRPARPEHRPWAR